MCLVLEWKTGMCASAIDPWLSPFRRIASMSAGFNLKTAFPSRAAASESSASALESPSLTRIFARWSSTWRRPSSVNNRSSHDASFAARVSAMYSASVDDNATVDGLWGYQLTGLLFSIKMKPDVDLRLSLSPAESESEHPSIANLSLPPYVIPRSKDPFR